MTARELTVSRSQVLTLQGLVEPAKVSNRTSTARHTIAAAAAHALEARGLITIEDGTALLTDLGRSFLEVVHVDPPPANPLHDSAAYQAGVALAVRDRRTAVVELQETIKTLEPGAPGYEFARHQIARFRQLDQQEGITS